jgi:hypothetical protein
MHAHLTHGLANAHVNELRRVAAATHAATAAAPARPRRLPRLKLRARSLGGRTPRPVLRRA